jgi:hypothetical protein
MKMISFFLFLCFLSFAVLAEEMSEVVELASGSCWLKEGEMGITKVSSFGENSSIQIYPADINQLIRSLTSEFKSIETFIHCGAYGMNMVFNLKSEKNSKCVWLKQKKNRMEVVEINGLKSKEGFCHGYVNGLLILKARNRDFIESEIAQGKLNEVIAGYSIFLENYFKLKLTKEYIDREDEALKMIDDYFSESGSVAYIELDAKIHPVGDYYKLESFSNR